MNVQQATEESIEDEPNLGTPKAPRLRFAGEPGRPCPGAPSKGRTPRSFYDLSEDAPVRRLNFMRCIDSSSVPVQSAACDDAAICGLQYEQPQQLSGQDNMQLLVQQQQQLMCQNETSDPPQQEQHRLLTSPGYRSLQCQHQLKHTPTLTAIPGHFKQQRSHQHSVWNALPQLAHPGYNSSMAVEHPPGCLDNAVFKLHLCGSKLCMVALCGCFVWTAVDVCWCRGSTCALTQMDCPGSPSFPVLDNVFPAATARHGWTCLFVIAYQT